MRLKIKTGMGVLRTMKAYKKILSIENLRTNGVRLNIETWSQFVNKKHFIHEAVKPVFAFP